MSWPLRSAIRSLAAGGQCIVGQGRAVDAAEVPVIGLASCVVPIALESVSDRARGMAIVPQLCLRADSDRPLSAYRPKVFDPGL